MAGTIRITQRRSVNGTTPAQRETLRSLGLRGIGKSIEKPDGPALQGMVRIVGHLVHVEEVRAQSPKPRAKSSEGEGATKDEQDG